MPCLHLCRLEQLSERSKASNDPDTTESTVGGTLVCGISCEEQPVDSPNTTRFCSHTVMNVNVLPSSCSRTKTRPFFSEMTVL